MRAVIVGVGGVGSWAAYSTALYGAQKNKTLSLLLVDADTIESHNVQRTFGATGNSVGMLKVSVVTGAIRSRLLTEGTVTSNSLEAYANTLTKDTMPALLNGADVVVCCTDTVEIQRLLHQYCNTQSIRYIRAGYDGDDINVTAQFPLTLDTEAEAADAGYHGIPTVIHAMVSGALAAYRAWNPDDALTVLGPLSQLSIADSSLVPARIAEKLADSRWRTIAEDENWHSANDCDHDDCLQRGDEAHYPDECNHDDCLPADSCHEIGGDCYDYVQDDADDGCLQHMVKRIHDREHSSTLAWCGYCITEAKEESKDDA